MKCKCGQETLVETLTGWADTRDTRGGIIAHGVNSCIPLTLPRSEPQRRRTPPPSTSPRGGWCMSQVSAPDGQACRLATGHDLAHEYAPVSFEPRSSDAPTTRQIVDAQMAILSSQVAVLSRIADALDDSLALRERTANTARAMALLQLAAEKPADHFPDTLARNAAKCNECNAPWPCHVAAAAELLK